MNSWNCRKFFDCFTLVSELLRLIYIGLDSFKTLLVLVLV